MVAGVLMVCPAGCFAFCTLNGFVLVGEDIENDSSVRPKRLDAANIGSFHFIEGVGSVKRIHWFVEGYDNV